MDLNVEDKSVTSAGKLKAELDRLERAMDGLERVAGVVIENSRLVRQERDDFERLLIDTEATTDRAHQIAATVSGRLEGVIARLEDLLGQ